MIRARVWVATLAAALLAAAPAAGVPRAAGGRAFLPAAEEAPLVVQAVVREWQRLDEHGHTASVEVRSLLRGEAERGARLTIAWEELSQARASRFAVDERVVLALEPLYATSIWLRRIPDPHERLRVLQVAARGEAFLREPAFGSVDVLEHYLKLLPADRGGPTGAGYLARLAARAATPLAASAVARLRAHAELESAGGRDLVTALLREDGDDELRPAILDLFATRRYAAARPPLEELAAREPPPPAVVFEALGRLDGGFSPQRSQRLLAGGSPAQRAAAARFAAGPGAEGQLERLLVRDPVPEVRAAAVERLVVLAGPAAADPALAALEDPEPQVRGAAARSLGSLGAPAVPWLQKVVETGSFEAAQAAVFGLSATGVREGRAALDEIAREHDDQKIRALAGLALGRALPQH